MQAISAAVQPKSRISEEIRDRIVLEHLPLVKAIAIRLHNTLPVHVELDDLNHAGVLGLFDAVTKYNDKKNVVFQAYAKHRIKGAILDSLRQLDWASRNMRKRQKQVDSVTNSLANKLGRTPLDGEVADEMGLTPDRWHRVQLELRNLGTVSATAHPAPGFDRPIEFRATPELQPDRMCGQRQLHFALARVMDKLPQRYQDVVFLHYTTEMTMKEIGEVMGVNQSRVSEIHKIALRKMATVLRSEGINSAEAF